MWKNKEASSLTAKDSQQELDWRQISPYEVIQMQNCKLYQFRKEEIYPSIKPPVSQCDPEETAEMLTASMEINGCGRFDPRFLKKTGPTNSMPDGKLNKSNDLTIKNCRNRNKMQEPLYKSEGDPQMVLDWSKITPYDLMRMQNCKTFDFQKCESYPNIRPPISMCDPKLTNEWLSNAVEDYGCGRLFDMEKDDLVEIWKRSPKNEILGFYGVGAGVQVPEAIEFNQVVSDCLDKVKLRQQEEKEKEEITSPRNPSKSEKQSPEKLMLNRFKLESKITKMPTLQKKLHPSNALNWIHCPRKINSKPFANLKTILDMEKPIPKSKFDLRKKHKYCDVRAEVENECKEYEWRKYKADPKTYENAFKKEMEDMKKAIENEPKNYEELYSELISCFEKDVNPEPDPISESYYKCCKQYFNYENTDAGGKGGKGGKGAGGKGGEGKDGERGRGDSIGVDGAEDGGDKTDSTVGGKEAGEGEEEGDGFGLKGTGDGSGLKGTGDGVGTEGTGDKEKKKGAETDTTVEKNKMPEDAKLKKAADKEESSKKVGKKRKALEKVPAKSAQPTKDQKEKGKLPKDQLGKELENVQMNKFLNYFEDLKKKDELEKFKSDFDPHKVESDESDEMLLKKRKATKGGKKGQADKEAKGKRGKRKRGKWSFGKESRGSKAKELLKETEESVKDCPCEMCEFMNRRKHETDPPFILEMLKEQKNRQLMEYRRKLWHQEYLTWQDPKYLGPQHKCEPIKCEESLYLDPQIAEYFDRLTALKNLQKLLCSNYDEVDDQLLLQVQKLTDRLCWRLNQFL